MAKKPGLGRGLDALLSTKKADIAPKKAVNSEVNGNGLKMIAVEKISKGEYQPRKIFDPDALQDLAESIKSQGLVQPIVVRKKTKGNYELIAGERRWRACQIAGLHEIPAIIKDIPDQAVAAVSLIENIQREDLNTLEEAEAMNRLINDFGLTHQKTAEAVGRSRVGVTNLLRLLELESYTKQLVNDKKINMGHARALLALKGNKQLDAAKEVAKKGLSVRETEKIVKRYLNDDAVKEKAEQPSNVPVEVRKLEQELSEKLGAPVAIQYNISGKGSLKIQYNNLDELDGILEHIK